MNLRQEFPPHSFWNLNIFEILSVFCETITSKELAWNSNIFLFNTVKPEIFG